MIKSIFERTCKYPEKDMTKEEIIKYIREYDSFFLDAHLESYSHHELMLIKISIDVEKSKQVDYKPMDSGPRFS